MTRRAPAAGFTLVELLVALALTGIVSLLVLSGTRFAALGLNRVATEAERLEARRSIEDLVRGELAATLASPLLPTAPPLVGGKDRVEFFSVAEDSGAGIYRIVLAAETSGSVRSLVLSRTRVSAGQGAAPQRVVLAPQLRRLDLAYYGAPSGTSEAAWQESWEGSRLPPKLVRIGIDTGDGLVRPPLLVRLWTAPE